MDECKALLTYSNGDDRLNVLQLAVPLLLETLFNTLINTVNTAVLSGYSESGVAAVGAVGTVLGMLTLAFTALSVGASVAVSNYLGAGDTAAAGSLAFVGAWLSGGIGLLLSVLCCVGSGRIVFLLNLRDTAYQQAVEYLRLRASALTVTALNAMLLSVLRCYGHMRSTVYVGVLTNVVNTVLSIVAVSSPALMGLSVIRKLGLAAVIGQVCGFLLTLLFCRRLHIRLQPVRTVKRFWGATLVILRLGIPAAVSGGSYAFAQTVRSSLAPLISITAASATVYYSNILSYTYLFSYSLGSAASIFVGRLCGAGAYTHAQRLNRLLVRCTCFLNLFLSLLVFLLRIPLLRLYTDTPQILAWSAAVFAIDIAAEAARAVSHIYEYALRGAGDVRCMMAAMLCSGWIFGVGGAYVFGIVLDMGVAGFFLATALDELCRAAVSVIRWRSGRWKTVFQKTAG